MSVPAPVSPRSGGRGRSVLFVIPPHEAESLLGWIVRSAHANYLPSCYSFLRRVGLEYERRPVSGWSGDIDEAGLAELLGSSIDEVIKRRAPNAEVDGFLLINGVALRRRDLVTATRRFAPSLVAADGIHRSEWMIRSLPYCAIAWQRLRDDCGSCGAIQRWRHAGHLGHCDRCGGDLGSHRTTEVPSLLRGGLACIASLIGADDAARARTLGMLPEVLNKLDAGEALELVIQLANLVDPDLPVRPARHAGDDDFIRRCRALDAAWAMLLSYPASINAIVDDIAYGRGHGGDRGRRRIVHLLRSSPGEPGLPRVASLMQVVESNLAQAGAVRSDRVRVKPAARMLGITESQMAAARDGGAVASTTSLSRGRLLKTLDRSEIGRLSQIRRGRMGRDAVGHALGLPGYGVGQLERSGILETTGHKWLEARFGGDVVTKTAVEDLVSRIWAASRSDSEQDWLPLRLVMRGYGGGPKPWSAVFNMMLSRDIAFEMTPGKRVADARVSPDAVTRIRSLEFGEQEKTYSQGDAAELLNLKLIRCQSLQSFRRATATPNSWRLDGPAIEELAQACVTIAELSARFGHHTRGIHDLLVKAGVPRFDDLGWCRAASRGICDLLR